MLTAIPKQNKELDSANHEAFLVDGVLICTQCDCETSIDDSFSNKGRHLICRACAEKYMKQLNIDFISEFCQQYIWKD